MASLRRRYLEQLSRHSGEPIEGAREIIRHVLDGDGPGRGSRPSEAELAGVGTEDVRRVWRRLLGTDGLYLTVVGDFDRESTLALLEERLCTWRPADADIPEARPHAAITRPGAFVVHRRLPAAGVVLAQLLEVDRSAAIEDHAALEIFDALLGASGLRSRLMRRLRARERITYSIRSSLSHQGEAGVPGELEIAFRAAGFQVARSVAAVLEELRELVAAGPTDEEVEEQIEAWENAFAFRAVDRFQSIHRLVELELEHRPLDDDLKMLRAVRRIKPPDVQRVVRRYLDPDRFTVAIFGEVSRTDLAALEEMLGLEELAAETVFGRSLAR
jgi:zinc protease